MSISHLKLFKVKLYSINSLNIKFKPPGLEE